MKRGLTLIAIATGILLSAVFLHHHFKHGQIRSTAMTHAKSEFTFNVHAPLAQAFPLFGPEGERPWAGPGWDPQYVYPKPAQDIEGAVFRIHHGHHQATWVITDFDAEAGHAAYVSMIDARLVTRIDVQLTPVDTRTTRVRVMYERTALDPSAYEEVRELARTDPKMGPEWEQAIANHLKGAGAH